MSEHSQTTGNPVFIFGVARSGTNLLARMLGYHPEISVALDPLMPLFRHLRNNILRTAGIEHNEDSPFQDYYFSDTGIRQLQAMMNADPDVCLSAQISTELLNDIAERAALEDQNLGDSLAYIKQDNLLAYLNTVFIAISNNCGKDANKWIGIKEVWTIDFTWILAKAFPQARFVFLIRDPRAVIASLEALAKTDPSQAAHTISYMRHWRKHSALAMYLNKYELPHGKTLIINYESLVANPEQQAILLCNFLDINFSSEMLNPGGNEWSGNSSFDKNMKSISSVAAIRWKKNMRKSMQKTIEFHCAPEMILSGYKAESHEPWVLSEDILQEIRYADRHPGKWRSDSGNVSEDINNELQRWKILTNTDKLNDVERYFLSEKIYQSMINNETINSITGACNNG